MVLEWWLPEHDLDKVQKRWDGGRFVEVRFSGATYRRGMLNTHLQLVGRHEERTNSATVSSRKLPDTTGASSLP